MLYEWLMLFGFVGIVFVLFGIMLFVLWCGLWFFGEGVLYVLFIGVFIVVYLICDGIGLCVFGSVFGYIVWVYLLWSVL